MTRSARALLNKTAARHYLGQISERTLDRLRASGRLRFIQYDPPTGKVFFDPDDLDEFIETNKTYRVEDGEAS